MPRMRFEHTISVFEQAKTVHASESAATVIDPNVNYHAQNTSPLGPTLSQMNLHLHAPFLRDHF
jgi:hypothetical protein